MNSFLQKLGFPGGSDGKESACNAGDQGSIPGLGRSPEEGYGYPLQYSCLKNYGQRRHSPWCHKELNLIEWLRFNTILFSIVTAPIYIPSSNVHSSLLSTFMPILVICCLSDNSQSNRSEVIYHCGFDLHYPDDS